MTESLCSLKSYEAAVIRLMRAGLSSQDGVVKCTPYLTKVDKTIHTAGNKSGVRGANKRAVINDALAATEPTTHCTLTDLRVGLEPLQLSERPCGLNTGRTVTHLSNTNLTHTSLLTASADKG